MASFSQSKAHLADIRPGGSAAAHAPGRTPWAHVCAHGAGGQYPDRAAGPCQAIHRGDHRRHREGVLWCDRILVAHPALAPLL